MLPIEERKFLTFDQDNFNDRMRAIKPRLQFYVENTLSEDDALLDVELEFESMEDFRPAPSPNGFRRCNACWRPANISRN